MIVGYNTQNCLRPIRLPQMSSLIAQIHLLWWHLLPVTSPLVGVYWPAMISCVRLLSCCTYIAVIRKNAPPPTHTRHVMNNAYCKLMCSLVSLSRWILSDIYTQSISGFNRGDPRRPPFCPMGCTCSTEIPQQTPLSLLSCSIQSVISKTVWDV